MTANVFMGERDMAHPRIFHNVTFWNFENHTFYTLPENSNRVP